MGLLPTTGLLRALSHYYSTVWRPSRHDMETCYDVAPLSTSWRHAASIRSCDLSHFPRHAALANPAIAVRHSSNADTISSSRLDRPCSERGPNSRYRDPLDLGHARHSTPRSNVRSDEATIRTTRRPFHPGKLVPAIFAQPCMTVPKARILIWAAPRQPRCVLMPATHRPWNPGRRLRPYASVTSLELLRWRCHQRPWALRGGTLDRTVSHERSFGSEKVTRGAIAATVQYGGAGKTSLVVHWRCCLASGHTEFTRTYPVQKEYAMTSLDGLYRYLLYKALVGE